MTKIRAAVKKLGTFTRPPSEPPHAFHTPLLTSVTAFYTAPSELLAGAQKPATGKKKHDSAAKHMASVEEAKLQAAKAVAAAEEYFSLMRGIEQAIGVRAPEEEPPAPPTVVETEREDEDDEEDETGEAEEAEAWAEITQAKRESEHDVGKTGKNPFLGAVPNEGEDIHGETFAKRAYAFRDRAQKIFGWEKARFAKSRHLTAAQRQLLEPFVLRWDKALARVGCCHYPGRKNGPIGFISLSHVMIDRGLEAKSVRSTVIHELTHAVLPGAKHSQSWKLLNIKMGGSGQRCSQDKKIKALVGYKILVRCSQSEKHWSVKRQRAPTAKWLRGKCCPKCKGKFAVYRVR